MNEAYLSLGYPIIVSRDEWIGLYWSTPTTGGKYRSIYASSPNQAIEHMHAQEITPLAMHFTTMVNTVVLNIIATH